MKILTKKFGEHHEKLISITNTQGLTLELSNYGARIVNLFVPTKKGTRNIVLGFDSASEYAEKDTYIGASIGRVAGRITNGQFKLDNEVYQLTKNEGDNNLHGGNESFDSRLWDYEIIENNDQISVEFVTQSADLENGFPGNLEAKVTYTLMENNQILIDYTAQTDKTTLYNPTNHVYFNLNRRLSEEIGNHYLMIQADKFATLTKELLPTAELASVEGTPFDFRAAKGSLISQGFDSNHSQNQLVEGYDHPFVLTKPSLTEVQATLTTEEELIKVNLYTDRPAVVVYTTNMLNEVVKMRAGEQVKHGGVTLETQVLPDAINQSGFGDIRLRPEEEFKSRTIFEIVY